MRLDLRRLARAQRAAFVLCLMMPLLGVASDTEHAARVLWVSAARSVFQVSPVDGTPQLELAGLPDVDALAVDQTTDHVWVYSHKHLWAYDAQGNALVSVRLPHDFHGGGPAGMAVDSSAGNVWIAIQRKLYRLDLSGKVQADFKFKHGIDSLTLDPTHSRLWIAERGALEVLAEDGSPALTVKLDHDQRPEALAYDPFLGQVWVATGHGLARYDQTGNRTFSIQMPRHPDLDAILAPDGQGGLWLAGARTLAHYDQSGLLQFSVQPFTDVAGDDDSNESNDGDESHGHKIVDLVADPLNHTAWVASRRYLKQISLNSTVLQTVDSRAWTGDKESQHGNDHGNGHGIQHVGLYVDTLPPTVAITAPRNGSYTNHTQPTVSLSYSDAGSGVDPGTITVTAAGVPVPVTCQSTDSSAQCTPTSALPDGHYTLSVTVADYAGNLSTPASVSFILDTVPPPLPGGAYIGFVPGTPGSVTLVGQVGGVASDVATVTVINIRTGQSITGSVHSDGSYSITLPGGSSDEFAITLTDLAGNVTAPFYLHGSDTALQLAITSPTAGAALAGNLVNVTGTFHGALNTGITVNGTPATSSKGQWVANNVSLTPGTNTLTVIATTSGGLSLTQSETVTSEAPTQLILTATPGGTGITPFTTTFQYQFLGATTPQNLKIDYTGSGNYVTVSDPTATLGYTYTNPGIYPVTLILTDANNAQYQAQIEVVVQDPAQMDLLFKGIWGDMITALASGNKAAAMNALDYTAKIRFAPVFDELMPDMKTILGSFSPLLHSSVNAGFSEYAVVRVQNGQKYLYFIDFLKGYDGIWRMESM